MGEMTEQVLAKAYQLIEEDRESEARSLLEPILAQEPENTDAWWIYAHAVETPEEARTALKRIIEVDPNYPGATELFTSLKEKFPEQPVQNVEAEPRLKKITPPPTLPDMPEESEEFADFDDEFALEDDDFSDDLESPKTESERRGLSTWILVPVLLVLIIAVVAILLLRNPGTEDNGQGGGGVSTLPASTAQIAEIPTQEGVDSEVTPQAEIISGDVEQAIENALAELETSGERPTQINTLLGNTLVIGLCSPPDITERSELLNQAMIAVSQASTLIDDTVNAIGVQIVNCETGNILRTVGASLSEAQSFAEGSLSEHDYQATWEPIL